MFYPKKTAILLGPRQVGKTFLLKKLFMELSGLGARCHYYNLELPKYLKE
ncbi:MAG TPA: hypothetical protein DCS13_05090 [Candidatus Margulisbacteria bacterium]|nr:hypothetical protein [Candidatus Margulisiibacteriota bacterium]